jgi:hypothetical protein
MKGTYEYTDVKDGYTKGFVYAKSREDASKKSGIEVGEISFWSKKKLKRLL